MRTIGFSLLLLAALAVVGRSESPTKAGSKAAPDKETDKKAGVMKRKPNFTIGKETTYVAGPIDEDGRIDYASALNKRLSQGVTPANNAHVLIWKVLGPRPEGARMSAEYFKWLGIDEPPQGGAYFIPLGHYLKEQIKEGPPAGGEPVLDALQHSLERPWTAARYPNIADWLKANEKPLVLVLEATKRSHYFSPLVPTKTAKGSSGLISALLPSVQKCRELASALIARAMLNIGEGRFDDAWRDLIACHRLGRLVAHGGCLIEGLVGISIEAVAGKADLIFLDAAKLDARRIMVCLDDLRKLPPMPLMADKVDLCERFEFLDCVMLVDRDGIGYFKQLGFGTSPQMPEGVSKLIMRTIDWDPAMRNGNRWYDRVAKAMRGADRATREKHLEEIESELKVLKVKTMETVQNPLKFLLAKDTGKFVGETMGNIMISLLLPAIHKVQSAADRAEQSQSNLQLAFALAAYRRDRGRYPAELKALAPKYLAKIPQDIFAGKALTYRRAENGYLLYSVGVNGLDDEGRGFDDEPRGDDLSVRMPPPKPKQLRK